MSKDNVKECTVIVRVDCRVKDKLKSRAAERKVDMSEYVRDLFQTATGVGAKPKPKPAGRG